NDHSLGGFLREESGCELGDALARGAFAHPNKNDTVAHGHDVATLNSCSPPFLLGVSPPHGRALKVRGKLVDSFHEQCLVMPRGPIKRIQRYSAVNPAASIAGI